MSRFLDEDDYDDGYDGQEPDLEPPTVKRRGSWWKNLLAITVSLAVPRIPAASQVRSMVMSPTGTMALAIRTAPVSPAGRDRNSAHQSA